MSLVDSASEQRRRIAKARKIQRAREALYAVSTDSYDDDDLYVARARLDNWLTEQPDYVRDAIGWSS